ncbi:uncharacterized protein LOC127281645 [Leptopilina boulardi]|uniref:uncharacterized protein LOC127281645 n=1 Tax=Leptopilina boulardi TaxID=63433 RepID=UPI0021F5507F|nr:uncharacterized protein LOC127281645 [Leptopilina boulardi]
MDVAKKARKVQRTLFTRCLNSFQEKCENANISLADRHVALQLLESRYSDLESTSNKYVEMIFESEASEDEITAEIESHEEYKLKFLQARSRLFSVVPGNAAFAAAAAPILNEHATPRNDKPFKRPTLEIPKFGGSVEKWLQFWSHFRKIHEDRAITDEDKLEYLKQSMERGSKAESIVSGYPTTAENYQKAFDSLKSRFGRDDLLIEFYTRELLSLVLNNASNHGKKVDVSCIYDKLSAHIRALETLGVTTNNCATMLYPLVESSLPEEILRTWQRSESNSENAADGEERMDRLSRLLQFLRIEVESEERINMAMHGFAINVESGKKKTSKDESRSRTSVPELATGSVLFANEDKRKKCIFCNNVHDNAACEKAKTFSYDTICSMIRENNCCFRCLKVGHAARKCRVRINCSKCGKHHSALVCQGDTRGADSMNTSKKAESLNVTKEQNLASFSRSPDVYMQTIRVVLYSDSKEKEARVVIDSGSHRSYIRSDVAKFLGYKPIATKEVTHSLFGGLNTESQQHNIFLIRMRNRDNQYACNFEVMDQQTICENIPSVKKTGFIEELERNNILLSDLTLEHGNLDNSIDVLIGADVAGKLMTGNKFEMSNGLAAFETKLGWVLMGKNPAAERSDAATVAMSMFVKDAKIADLWSLDILGIKDPIEKTSQIEKEQIVENQFLKSVVYTEEKRYSVDLPWNDNHAPVSQNFELSKKRLNNTVAKLKRDDLFFQYDQVFKEWQDEGIIEPVVGESGSACHYLPHRPVVKEESTTKIRPVFDASANVAGFPSLNQCLEKGPNLIELIPATLLRFREHEIAVLADIRKAFLQIGINEQERNYLRFLWLVDDEIKIFRHRRVVFGLKCSPFLLGAVLKLHFSNLLQAAKDGKGSWSCEIIEKLSKSFYVDNCTTSVESKEKLQDFIKSAKEMMALGSFDLREWEYTRDDSDKESTLVLGLLFNKIRDTISVNPALLKDEGDTVVTKRSILSVAHKVFDPIGFTSPVTLLPKLLLKNLWKQKLDWDDPVDKDTQKAFLNWKEQLSYLEKIEVTRKFGTGDFSIHTFCDASKSAYATVTFLRVKDRESVNLIFLGAKSRVAPDGMSIPRLELLAASIGARQTKEIVDALDYSHVPIFFWSDSTTVLAWVKRDIQWAVFVWNRVKEIRLITSSATWKYVPGELNPADLPSRGCQAKQLLDSRWWEGPDWLRREEIDWPCLREEVNEDEVRVEVRKSAQIALLNADDQINFSIVDKFSSYNKMIRFFAIMLKFKNYKINGELTNGKKLTFNEIYKTEKQFLKVLQNDMFCHENK